MRRLIGFLFVAGVALFPGAVLAHEGHHHVIGTVTAIDATHVEVRTKEGNSSSVRLSSATQYYKGSKGKNAGAISDLKVGTRVVIDLAKDGSASEVRVPSSTLISSPKK